MQNRKRNNLEVLATPGHLVGLAARGFERLSELRLKPFGFGVGYLPVLVAVEQGNATSQRDLARFARVEQPSMAQMLARMERDALIRRSPDPDDGRSSRVELTKMAHARLPEACAVLFEGNREVLRNFTDKEAQQLVALLARLIANLDFAIDADAPRSKKPGRSAQRVKVRGAWSQRK
jgi:MarR family transcriptional regulator, transcriptional regulator for hemolysin